MGKRKTYEKYEQINSMFDALEQQIVESGDLSHLRNHLYYVNHQHRENYEALILYYSQANSDPIIDGACYVIAIPEIFNVINIFDNPLPFSWVYTETGLTEEMKSLSVHFQYLVAAALETSQIQIFTPSGYTMGITHWNIHQLRLFWQYTAIVRREAL
ncbi:DUF2538 family protein [Mammaliicoccus stepanovicii]|uniref:LytR family transcriptional regulator n=1 Tax=Mammaliicoccus stepanovicii TaxID=643214 RepID=A0A239ZRB1_9STAP|nr:DUF2538 family protein [Mammaliicoccus stepanovicii]PNZ73689.1 DUF2538 domain-containing protein [Mammaliicoccus stepanovicii]GGI43444.1 hypothetical protein GCM10010896_23450 [Mammaliicoccus stepanovicii]SNV73557.1 LytR family transcriptional regulator [Mammaliicoccus stepanovicii]